MANKIWLTYFFNIIHTYNNYSVWYRMGHSIGLFMRQNGCVTSSLWCSATFFRVGMQMISLRLIIRLDPLPHLPPLLHLFMSLRPVVPLNGSGKLALVWILSVSATMHRESSQGRTKDLDCFLKQAVAV